jgi:plasmid stabilization system protein ParE
MKLRFARRARADQTEILAWSLDYFGEDAAERYRVLINRAAKDLLVSNWLN